LITDGSFSFDPEYRRRKENDLVPLCLLLLDSPDVYLQHESLELLHALLQSPHLQVREDNDGCVGSLHFTDLTDDAESHL